MADNVKELPDQAGGWMSRPRRFFGFLTEVRSELSRVTWPTRREVWATTVVVILVSLLFGLYLYLVDTALSAMLYWLFARFGG